MSLTSSKYKLVYRPLNYRPEFIEWLGREQARLMMEIQALDDEAKREARVVPPYYLIPLGALIGALIGGGIALWL